MWSYGNYMNINIGNLLKYFATLSVSFHDINSLFGFFTFLTIFANNGAQRQYVRDFANPYHHAELQFHPQIA